MGKILSILALVAIAAGAAIWFGTRGDTGNGDAPVVPDAGDAPASRPADGDTITPATAVVEFVDEGTVPPEELELTTIKLPDGRRVPTLNGVRFKNPPTVAIPKSPIVGIETEPTGRQYYRHEDGSITKPSWIKNLKTGQREGIVQVIRMKPLDPGKIMNRPEGARKPIVR